VRDAVTRLSATLAPRDRAILSSRILAEDPVPLRRFGPTVRLSGERVRQLEKDMLTKLRDYLGTSDEVRHSA
jgi:DNA-directed RNA polymerase sigma subunit (sigma70/sigma32)